ncbi:MAG: DNA methyltransferase [Candidatus Heimdallarchaeota archaeon]
MKKKQLRARKNPARRLNGLTGSEWVQWSKSVWRFADPVTENYGHPAIFPEFLAERVIRSFSKQEDLILDPMVGTGTTVHVARGLNRNAIGLDISKHWVEVAQKRIKNGVYTPKTVSLTDNSGISTPEKGETEQIPKQRTSPILKLIHDDARNLLKHVNRESVDLCFTSPPYWTGLHGIKGRYTGQTQKQVKQYSNLQGDLGNIADYNEFLIALKDSYKSVFQALKPLGYFVSIIQDTRRGSTVIPLHIHFHEMMVKLGFQYQDLIIWEHPTYTTRPLGFPTTFVISRVHDYVMVFRKQ